VSHARAAEDGETRKQGALNRHAISPNERAIALLEFDEIASLAVAIETFLLAGCFACTFSKMPMAVTPIGRLRHGGS